MPRSRPLSPTRFCPRGVRGRLSSRDVPLCRTSRIGRESALGRARRVRSTASARHPQRLGVLGVPCPSQDGERQHDLPGQEVRPPERRATAPPQKRWPSGLSASVRRFSAGAPTHDKAVDRRRRIAPMIAAIHVLQSKNSSIGSPKPSALAMSPPMTAPTIPMRRNDDSSWIVSRKDRFRDRAGKQSKNDPADDSRK